MEWEGVNLDRKWRMCMERERRKIKEDEVVDLVARGLVGDLARHMSCLQEQVDQVKRQQLQLILNQIVKATAEVETEEISCPENAKENGNLLLADSRPLSKFDMGKMGNGESLVSEGVTRRGSNFRLSAKGMAGQMDDIETTKREGSPVSDGDATSKSTFIPRTHGMEGGGNTMEGEMDNMVLTRASLQATEANPKREMHQEHGQTSSNMGSLDSPNQNIVTVRPRIIKRQCAKFSTTQ